MSFSWFGRQMESANVNGTAITYKYNADGLRTEKKVGSTVSKYEYTGDKLFYEKRGDLEFHYRYDVFGNVASITRVKADGTSFSLYTVCNSRGDVEELRRSTGELFARYVYDSWGNVLHIYDVNGAEITSTANFAVQNPFRYKGYYYDNETGLYYVGSRYYDPVTHRFVNADTTDVLTVTPMGLTDKNLFAYCDNNPASRKDSEGYAWETVFDVVSLGFSIAEVAANPYDIGSWIGLVGDTIDLIPFVTGVGEITRVLRFVDKFGNTLEIAKAVDFTDDARKAIDRLDNINGFTKSTRFDGIDIHKGYKKGDGFLKSQKEYNKIDGIRPDYYDGETIYELKPFNPKSAKQGVKQLKRYCEKIPDWRIARLEFY